MAYQSYGVWRRDWPAAPNGKLTARVLPGSPRMGRPDSTLVMANVVVPEMCVLIETHRRLGIRRRWKAKWESSQ
jgi:hypothetical protein